MKPKGTTGQPPVAPRDGARSTLLVLLQPFVGLVYFLVFPIYGLATGILITGRALKRALSEDAHPVEKPESAKHVIR